MQIFSLSEEYLFRLISKPNVVTKIFEEDEPAENIGNLRYVIGIL
jgi:hypothetical protein